MDELVVKDIESGRKGDRTAKTILGAGTSSVVYLVDKNKAEKSFKSPKNLLNEQTIYQILGSHPRLLSIHHFGAEGIIMDWMEKGDLARYIKSHPEVAQRRKHQWIAQIAESFSLLHKHHISHCDSKLENFLLDDDYNIKICDFASSHNYRSPSHDPAIQPPRYRRAVDDFDETVFNPADDIFAFGSICYEIVTGGPLYPQLDDESVRLRFIRGSFTATEGLCFGPIIRDCWNGTYISFEAILRSIEREGPSRTESNFVN
ncbi:hypothetical protein ONS95_005356 [Cadophora gregata]|uniref:uncharacterized protein n=1 Tax=Cadophora gregata TaxID=51156 RepID=UPI0026DA9A0B|nr:uncharacterized protein ONS95_005356 [Cadophora gregata]KAK0103327.1 hypothetical protein ONS95_005356 [Cadophora gregata]KAK0107519.1 hypothetical protein ONS96_003327 [Cadophora gregata f. sp. sojae]